MRSIVVIWLITLLSLTSLSAVNQPAYLRQDGKTIFVDAYWELVRSTRQAVIQMGSKPEADVRQQLDALAMQWDQFTAVELADHTIVALDSAYLISELRSDPPDLEQLEQSLDALLHAHDEFPQKVFTIEDVDTLNEILARPEFQWGQGQTVTMPAWLEKLFDAIADFTDRVILGLVNLLYKGRLLFMIAAAILFMLILLFISRNLSRNLQREAQLAEDGSEDAVLSSKGAMQRAQTLSAQGDYRNAIRYLYLSSLLALDEKGLLRYDRSRTNREYLRSVSSHAKLVGPLRDVIDVFDRVWYGFESVDEQTYQTYVEHVEELSEKKE